MNMLRIFRSVVVSAGVACLAISAAGLPGCGDDSTPSGGQVKADPAEAAKRQQNIENMYKSQPIGKGPGGQLPPNAKK